MAWAREQGLRLAWVRGRSYGSFSPVCNHQGQDYDFIGVYNDRKVEIKFAKLTRMPPFDRDDKRLELLHRLNELLHINLPQNSIDRYPRFELAALTDPAVLKNFLALMAWVMDAIKGREVNHD